MAWIYNKVNGVLTECVNNDITKICKKDAESYVVTETLKEMEELLSKENNGANGTPEETLKNKKLEDMLLKELQELAKEKELTNCSSLTKPELLKVLQELDVEN